MVSANNQIDDDFDIAADLPKGPIGPDALAAYFSVSRRTVENWRADGLRFSRMGGKVFTTRDEVRRYTRPATKHSADANPSGDEGRSASARAAMQAEFGL